MNLITRLLFGKRYFGIKISNEECEEFKDIIYKQGHLVGAFNINDFVPLLKPFDLQGLQHQMKQIRLRLDQFLDKIIQDHMKEKKLKDSKDFLDAMLSLREIDGFNDKLDDNKVKAIINVSCSNL
jgi:cytochrome P450